MRNRSQYPDNWEDEIRPRILSRDNFKCTSCGIKHRSYIFIDQNNKVIIVNREEHLELKVEGLRTYRVYLQVAHKNNIKNDCRDENLTSNCTRCHHQRDKAYKSLLRIAQLAAGRELHA